MLYLITKSQEVEKLFTEELKNTNSFQKVENDFFNFYENTNNSDILILDVDSFDSLEKQMYFFIKLPKDLKVIAITKNPKLVDGAILIKKGFKSYIGTNTNKTIIDIAIESVLSGNVWLYPQLMNFIIEHISLENENVNEPDIFQTLSQKEQEVATLVANGLSNKEIAEKLEVQLVTVKKHIGNIFTKLNVKDRLSLALLVHK